MARVGQISEEAMKTPTAIDSGRVSVRATSNDMFKVTECGLEIIPDANGEVPYEAYIEKSKEFFKITELYENYLPWWVGDFVLFGEARYGERMAQIFDAVGIKYKTVRNWVYTCKHVPKENRLPANVLSYSHHHVVAPLDHASQKKALAYAVENALSVVEFKMWLAGSKNPVKDASKYYEEHRQSLAKVGPLPEGLKEQPWAAEHRARVTKQEENVGPKIKSFGEWFDENEDRIESIADTREACQFVWDGCMRNYIREA